MRDPRDFSRRVGGGGSCDQRRDVLLPQNKARMSRSNREMSPYAASMTPNIRSRSSGMEHCASSRWICSSAPETSAERQRARKEPPRTRICLFGEPACVRGESCAAHDLLRTSSRMMSPTDPPIARKQKISMMHQRRRQYVSPASTMSTLHALTCSQNQGRESVSGQGAYLRSSYGCSP